MQHQSASPIADRVRIYADSKRLNGIEFLPVEGRFKRLRVIPAVGKKASNAKF
jgi:hypothetical protein